MDLTRVLLIIGAVLTFDAAISSAFNEFNETCEYVTFVRGPEFCFAELFDASTVVCASLDPYDMSHALTINPITGEYFAVVSYFSELGWTTDHTETLQLNRTIIRFNATIASDGSSVTLSDLIVLLTADPDEFEFKLNALTMSCPSETTPMLFGMSGSQSIRKQSGNGTQSIFIIDYTSSSGSISATDRLTSLITFEARQYGSGIVYNLDNDYLYEFSDSIPSTDTTMVRQIDISAQIAGNYDDTSDLITDLAEIVVMDGEALAFANYYNETHVLMGRWVVSIDIAIVNMDEPSSGEAISVSNNNGLTLYGGTDGLPIKGIVCLDIPRKCIDTFTTEPSSMPSNIPSILPSDMPSEIPSINPSAMPSAVPTSMPSMPTNIPSDMPTVMPSDVPSDMPSSNPSDMPTVVPTTEMPSDMPSNMPTGVPSDNSSSDGSSSGGGGGGGSEMTIVVIVVCVVAVLLIVGIAFMYKKYKRSHQELNENIALKELPTKSQGSK